MKWLAALAAVALAVGVAGGARAHDIPARRAVDVQAEPDALVLLVTYTAPNGATSNVLAARAAWGRAGQRSGAAMEGALVRRALAPIEARSGRRELEMKPLKTVVFGDPAAGRPLGVSVLVELPLARPGILTLDVGGDARTRLRWRARGVQILSPSHPRAGRWARGDRPLSLVWSDA